MRWKDEFEYPNRKQSDYVFPSPRDRNKSLYRNYVAMLFRKICKKQHLRHINPYLIRHTKLTFMNKNLPEKIAAKYGGHSVQVSAKYTHLNDDDIKAFSIPGGYIFVANGLLKLCNDESEFAAIIAHEMMHIILKHGLKEMGERSVKRKADLAFDELQKEIGVELDSTELELEEFALEAYENVMKPRIQRYEEECDRGAVLLLIQLGYDPKAVPRIVLKIRNTVRRDSELEMENPFSHLDFKNRYEKVNQFIKEVAPGFRGEKNTRRFRNNIQNE